MTSGKLNLGLGALGLVLAGLGGFALGVTIDPIFEKGFAAIPLARFLLRGGHPHGMLISLVNVVVGLALPRLALGEAGKKACAIFTASAFLLPVGLVLRGATGGAMTFAPLSMLGGVAFVVGAVLLALGGLRTVETVRAGS